MREQTTQVNIIGAGLAGLSAAKTFAEQGIKVRLISRQPSERAQSNLAEGGINAAMDVMGEHDTTENHFVDSMKGGCYMADPEMVRDLTEAAPGIIEELLRLGVPFHMENGRLIQRNFGGQKLKRTTYAKSSTGKVLVEALISAVRRYEAAGLVTRLCHHVFEMLHVEEGQVAGVQVYDQFRRERVIFEGPVLMACGGLNGMFVTATTGTTANTADAAAMLFLQGMHFGNLEFIQYHPTTVQITRKRLLISEAARGEGGRLFYYKEGNSPDIEVQGSDADKGHNGARCYFMEEKFGERGNLMPRDVISREMALHGKQSYLDMTAMDQKTWDVKLSDLRDEVIHYLGIDPAREPIPVSPGIHYFMGGILVDRGHRTNLDHVYAAGECACAYHGANRLGGNSLLGAVYGGKTAAKSILKDVYGLDEPGLKGQAPNGSGLNASDMSGSGLNDPALRRERPQTNSFDPPAAVSFSAMTPDEEKIHEKMTQVLLKGMAPLRTEAAMQEALNKIRALEKPGLSQVMTAKLLLAEAMLMSALERKETRGAHTRLDYPDTEEKWKKTTVISAVNGRVQIAYEEITPYPEA